VDTCASRANALKVDLRASHANDLKVDFRVSLANAFTPKVRLKHTARIERMRDRGTGGQG
jgi:hypothetical protein